MASKLGGRSWFRNRRSFTAIPEFLAERRSSSELAFRFKPCWTTWRPVVRLAEFLDDFPTVSRSQAIAVLEQAREMLTA